MVVSSPIRGGKPTVAPPAWCASHKTHRRAQDSESTCLPGSWLLGPVALAAHVPDPFPSTLRTSFKMPNSYHRAKCKHLLKNIKLSEKANEIVLYIYIYKLYIIHVRENGKMVLFQEFLVAFFPGSTAQVSHTFFLVSRLSKHAQTLGSIQVSSSTHSPHWFPHSTSNLVTCLLKLWCPSLLVKRKYPQVKRESSQVGKNVN